MKRKLFFALPLALTLLAMMPGGKHFGKKIDAKGAVSVSELPKMLAGKTEVATKLKGKIVAVCQKKGCWMTMDLGNGQSMRVTFKDYAFFVPKDAGSATAIIQGKAMRKVLTEDELRHYAHDAGKSKEEQEKIKGNQEEITFEAEGVLIEG